MYQVRNDVSTNRLYITLKGFMSDDELKTAVDEVIKSADTMQPGFDVINDLSEMKVASQEGAKEIARAQRFLADKGVRRVIRVVTDFLTQAQFGRTGRSAGYRSDADIAATVAEAEKMLDDRSVR